MKRITKKQTLHKCIRISLSIVLICVSLLSVSSATLRASASASDYTYGCICNRYTTYTHSGINYPTSIKKGNCFGLRGTIKGNGIYKVWAFIEGISKPVPCVQGRTYGQEVYNGRYVNLDIRYSHINNDLLFNKLDRGQYYYYLNIERMDGSTETFRYRFEVK